MEKFLVIMPRVIVKANRNLYEDQVAALYTISLGRGISESALLRDIIDEYLQRRNYAKEVAA